MRAELKIKLNQERNKVILDTLKLDSIEVAKERVGNWCIQRLGISHRLRNKFSEWLDVVPNSDARIKDKFNFKASNVIRGLCRKYKVSEDKIKEKVILHKELEGLSERNKKFVRDYFGVKFNASIYMKEKLDPGCKRENKIKSLWQSGKKHREIAAECGIPVVNAIAWINRLRWKYGDKEIPLRAPGGYPRRPGYTAENVAKLIHNGYGVLELSKKFNKSSSAMARAICSWRYRRPELNIPNLSHRGRKFIL